VCVSKTVCGLHTCMCITENAHQRRANTHSTHVNDANPYTTLGKLPDNVFPPKSRPLVRNYTRTTPTAMALSSPRHLPSTRTQSSQPCHSDEHTDLPPNVLGAGKPHSFLLDLPPHARPPERPQRIPSSNMSANNSLLFLFFFYFFNARHHVHTQHSNSP
jgi:hypothetical protein